MKKLTKKVTAVLLAFSMIMPAGGTAMPVEAAEDGYDISPLVSGNINYILYHLAPMAQMLKHICH